MDWEKLLSAKTQIPREAGPSSWAAYPVDAFEKDYREILSGELFRNLQDKTQIFPLVRGGYVRTRLTHSLEVSAVCRQLGEMVACNRKGEEYAVDFGEKSERYARNFASILSCAGLLHDIGNPPFGHFGETAIGDWFRRAFARNGFVFDVTPVREVLSEQMKQDLVRFEGNAQTLRILLRAQRLLEYKEMNVTHATINTLVKYPVASTECDTGSGDVRLHKWGYFLADAAEFQRIRGEAGLTGPARYPLTYLLEAADDIAYMLSDTEDSLRMKLFTIDQVLAYFERELGQIPSDGDEFHELQKMATTEILNNLKRRLRGKTGENARTGAFLEWLEYIRNWLMYAAAFAFFRNYDGIMAGTYRGELLDDGWYAFTADILKGIMKKYTYPCREILMQELSGQKIIKALLDKFIPSVLYWDTKWEGIKTGKVEKSYLGIIPEKYKDDYERARTGERDYDLYLRLLMVTDYISGMTDTDAKDTFQTLEGF